MAKVSSGGGSGVVIDGTTLRVQFRTKGGGWGPWRTYDDAPESVLAIARALVEGREGFHLGWNVNEPSLARAMRTAGMTAREVAE